MPRSARLDAPGVLHHIMVRGLERRKIFRDNIDRDDFLERLSDILPATNTSCYAWSFMPNHAHFLFRSGESGISKVMSKLLTGYAVKFNFKYRRHGPLFQNRYKSVICQEDAYLKELVRYIHLNPLRGNIVTDIQQLERYPYAGHSALMGQVQYEWQDTKYVLAYFGKTLKNARKEYLVYVKEGIDKGRRPELVGGGLIRSLGGWAEVKSTRLNKKDRIKSDERILGDSEFVTQVIAEANEELDRKYKLKSMGYDMTTIEKKVIDAFNIDKEDLYSGNRKKAISKARSVFCYWCVRELGESMTIIAKKLGITQPAVGYAVDRGKTLVDIMKINLIK
jgi:putative transposase